MTRSDDDDWSFPYINGQGSLHDLSGDGPTPRLAGMRSVSRAGADALMRWSRKPATRQALGFHTGKPL